MPEIEIRNDGGIALIVIDNPPVNALKHAVRKGLMDALQRAEKDAAVAAVALTCAGRTFVAGADITEFDKPLQDPGLPEVIACLDTMSKPVVAALFGTTLGGGLELALGCHYRIAAPTARLGLPEIKLGLIPGAGGTQRLPRVVGMEKAMAMILSGEPIPAQEALDGGLVTEIVQGDLTQGAIAFARKVALVRPLPRIRDRDDKLAPLRADRAAFDAIAAPHIKRARGLDAPKAAIAALRATLEVPFDEGVRFERDSFSALRAGDQSKARRHIFFAEREAAKVPGLSKDAAPREIKRAAVIGSGTMGGGIAMCFANAGIPITIVEVDEGALARGRSIIEKNYRASVSRGSLSSEDMERRLSLLQGATDIARVADADIVIEAVFEEIDVKREVFARLDLAAKPEAVLATNTSYLDVNAIAQNTRRPGAVLGLHFFSPANVMRLLEIVRGPQTSDGTLATALALARRIGKIPAVVGVCHGFVGNRMLRVRFIEAERLLIEGALPKDVDDALTAFGFPMGPFAMNDLAGLDVSWRMRKAQGERAEIADRLCELGHFGQKTGSGFYRYDAGSRAAIPDPEVAQLIEAASRKLGIVRRSIDAKEIVERLLFPMINEGARILDEGIALRASDIDVVWVYGFGFPAWRGGPMFYADHVGLPYICERLTEFASRTGDIRHQPAQLLARLASEGRSFASFSAKAA